MLATEAQAIVRESESLPGFNATIEQDDTLPTLAVRIFDQAMGRNYRFMNWNTWSTWWWNRRHFVLQPGAE